MYRAARIDAALILFLFPDFALAQSDWPPVMRSIGSGVSQSPVNVVIPPNVTIEPPTPDIPPDKAKWSGKWSGWACHNQVCDLKLIVEKVTAGGATIIYAFASSQIKPFNVRVEAQFVGNELQATLQNGARLSYRMRKEGAVEFLSRKESQWVAGILSKDN